MEKFFKDLMLSEHAIFTLWGSKPMVCAYIPDVQDHSFGSHDDDNFKKDVAYCREMLANWEKWEKMKPLLPSGRYLFVKKMRQTTHLSIAELYFVDIAQTAFALSSHYERFKEAIGHDFEPLQIVNEMAQEQSELYDKIFNSPGHPELIGLLFGFGDANAWGFQWKWVEYPRLYAAEETFLRPKFSNLGSSIPPPECITLSNFPIPCFASYAAQEDEVIKRYEREREEIRRIYAGQDFLQLTLKKLISS